MDALVLFLSACDWCCQAKPTTTTTPVPAPAPAPPAPAGAVEGLKGQGNAAFAAQDYSSALGYYTQGIELDPDNYILFSNRCVCVCLHLFAFALFSDSVFAEPG